MLLLNIQSHYTLNNGVKIPVIGLGTCHIFDNQPEQTAECIKYAIKNGYRLIDTAQIYLNETAVGKAIKECGVPRDELFIVSKLWNDKQGYKGTLNGFESSLAALGLTYLDLYLIHWPIPRGHLHDHFKLNIETWKAFEKLYEEKKIKAIGVSNFMIPDLENLRINCHIIPAINQIEFHPGDHTYDELRKYCSQHGIKIMAYGPIARNQMHDFPVLTFLAKKYKKSVAQICIRWAIQNNTIPIPKSSNKTRLVENLQVFDFVISDDDMQKIYKEVTFPNFFGNPFKESPK